MKCTKPKQWFKVRVHSSATSVGFIRSADAWCSRSRHENAGVIPDSGRGAEWVGMTPLAESELPSLPPIPTYCWTLPLPTPYTSRIYLLSTSQHMNNIDSIVNLISPVSPLGPGSRCACDSIYNLDSRIWILNIQHAQHGRRQRKSTRQHKNKPLFFFLVLDLKFLQISISSNRGPSESSSRERERKRERDDKLRVVCESQNEFTALHPPSPIPTVLGPRGGGEQRLRILLCVFGSGSKSADLDPDPDLLKQLINKDYQGPITLYFYYLFSIYFQAFDFDMMCCVKPIDKLNHCLPMG